MHLISETFRYKRIYDLESEMSDDEDLAPKSRQTPEAESSDILVQLLDILAVIKVNYPILLFFRICKSLLWSGQALNHGALDVIESLVRFFSSFLLTCTILYFAHHILLDMKGSCLEGQICQNFYGLFTLPQNFQEAVCSGALLVAILRIVDIGLG